MNKKVDLNKYSEFVEGITSKASEDLATFAERLDAVHENWEVVDGQRVYGPQVNVPLLITASIGMCGEAGEFSEIVKKVMFHGKCYTNETRDHAIRELGDIFWYWTNACRSVGVSPDEVIQRNVDKLVSRYPGGVFSVEQSRTREAGDI